ncbi:9061_t:CDS:2 [Paraglomus occultum]|uniref:9061_t:CDS:1 n=1 Tax=Paraglomus occultum TaxID=144539 RepID=A0A9N8ZY82_9GLOM|nr:9061_t:CDS:2 [Paraglomus occultum]
MSDTFTPSKLDRASLAPGEFIATVTTVTSLWAFFIGSIDGAKRASLQYLAEHAHVLPKTKQGWYLYHRRKNYAVILNSGKIGLQYVKRFGGLTLVFTGTQAALDKARGEADMIDSVVAGAGTGLANSFLYRLSRRSTLHACMIGGAVGLFAGGMQDMINIYQGKPVWYWKQKSNVNGNSVVKD